MRVLLGLFQSHDVSLFVTSFHKTSSNERESSRDVRKFWSNAIKLFFCFMTGDTAMREIHTTTNLFLFALKRNYKTITLSNTINTMQYVRRSLICEISLHALCSQTEFMKNQSTWCSRKQEAQDFCGRVLQCDGSHRTTK